MIFAILTLLSALSLAAVAGWFSIIGVIAIYGGAPIHALIMGIVAEGAKLVTTSWLYRNWDHSGWLLKAPLILFTVILMLVTSIGVFGFLSKAHLQQGAATLDNGPKIERLDQQIAREKATIADSEKVIAQLDATINSYLGKDRADRSVVIRRSQAPQRKQLRDDIDAANKRIDALSEERLKLQSEVRAMELEVGPVRYIAELIYGSENNDTKTLESAVKIFTLLIVSTLDPLAVILLIAANHTLLRRKNEKEKIKVSATQEYNTVSAVESGTGKDITRENTGIESNSDIGIHPGLSAGPIQIEVEKETQGSVPVSLPEAPLESINEEKDDAVQENTHSDTDATPSVDSKDTSEGLQWNKTISSSEVSWPSIPAEETKKVVGVVAPRRGTVESTETKIEPPATRVVPWAQQESVLRELVGSRHFIPQVLDEEKINKVQETLPTLDNRPSGETEADSLAPTKKIQAGALEEDKKVEKTVATTESETSSATLPPATSTYPKTLAWIEEFKNDK